MAQRAHENAGRRPATPLTGSSISEIPEVPPRCRSRIAGPMGAHNDEFESLVERYIVGDRGVLTANTRVVRRRAHNAPEVSTTIWSQIRYSL